MNALTIQNKGLVQRSFVHARIAWRHFSLFLLIGGFALAFTLPFPINPEEFSQFTFLYGLFLAPLVGAWITSRLTHEDPVQPLWVVTRFSLWRLALEKNILGWLFYLVAWTFFLVISWLIYGLRTAESPLSDLGWNLMGHVWLSGSVSLLFFSSIGIAVGKPHGAERGGLFATILWIAFIVGGRYGAITQWSPFGAFFDLQQTQWVWQQGSYFLVSLTLFGFGLARLRRQEASYGEVHRIGSVGRENSLFTGSLLIRLPGMLRLVWMEILMAVRRKVVWVYVLLPIGILVTLLATGDEVLTSFAPLALANLLFVLLPLQAIYIAPALTRHNHSRHDWFWSTPSLWTKAVAAQAVAYGLVTVLLSVFFLPLALISGMLVERWTWFQLSQIILPIWVLSVVAILAQAFMVCALAFLLRRAIAVIAVASLTALGVYFSLVSPALSLLDARDVTLASLSLNPITGIVLDFPLALWMILIHLALGLLLWHTGLLTYPWREPRVTWITSMYWRVGTAWTLSLGLVLVAILGYGRQVHALIVPESTIVQSDWWTIQDVSHVAQMGKDRLQIDSQLEMLLDEEKSVGQIELLLNPGLQVQSAQLDDQALRWSREGEVVRLVLPTSVKGGEEAHPLKISIAYAGWPVLLREDYDRTNDATFIGNRRVTSHTLETVSYVDEHSLQWFRDSDWLIWPPTSQMHVAAQSNHVEISVPKGSFDTFVFPGETEHSEGQFDHYTWLSTPPSVLLLAGEYQKHGVKGQHSVFLGEFQSQRDLDWAEVILDIYERLSSWFDEDTDSLSLAFFPYGERVHMVYPWVLVPADTPYDFQRFQQLPLNLAVLIAEDWLREQIAWQDTPISTRGLLLSASVSCDYVTEENTQLCVIDQKHLRRNPQAPNARSTPIGYCLYPSSMNCGYILPLRRALALALTYYAAADPLWLNGGELQQWRRLADDALGLRMLGVDQFGQAFSPLHDSCAIARNLVIIHSLMELHGHEFLKEWVGLIKERHPLGSKVAVDREIWNLAAEITGEVPSSYEAICSNIVIED